MNHAETRTIGTMLVVASTAVAILGGCGSAMEDPTPERAYWQQDTSPPPAVKAGRLPTGRLGLRRRTDRPDALPPETLSKAEDLSPDAGDEPISSAVATLSGTGPFEEDNVNLDVRPTLAEGFAQRVVEGGVWFGVGQMLGGGPVSVAIFTARHWE